MRRLFQIPSLVLLLVFSSCARAEVLNGAAVYQELGEDKFMLGLYLPESESELDSILALTAGRAIGVRMLDDRLSARWLNKVFADTANLNANAQVLNANAQSVGELRNLFKGALFRDDYLEFRELENSISVELNGIRIHEFINREFFNVLLGAWLGDVPPSRKFKSDLLEGKSLNIELFRVYNNSAERSEEISRWQLPELERPITEVLIPEEESETAVDEPQLTTNATVSETEASVELTAEPEPGEEDEAGERERRESVMQDYRQALNAHPASFVEYPLRSQMRGEQGTVFLAVLIDAEGRVQDVKIDTSSEFAGLDRAAIRAVKKASPFPSIPQLIDAPELSFVIPLSFRMDAAQ